MNTVPGQKLMFSTRTVEHKAIVINLMNINSFNKTLE